MLTEQQQKVFDKMLEYIEKKENYFLSSEDRNIGKTFILNELAFTGKGEKPTPLGVGWIAHT